MDLSRRQKGVRPEVKLPSIDLVADGYRDPKGVHLHADRSDVPVEELLAGENLFPDSMIWNGRPRSLKAYFDANTRHLYFYEACIYLPDSHHRNQPNGSINSCVSGLTFGNGTIDGGHCEGLRLPSPDAPSPPPPPHPGTQETC